MDPVRFHSRYTRTFEHTIARRFFFSSSFFFFPAKNRKILDIAKALAIGVWRTLGMNRDMQAIDDLRLRC